MMKLVGVSELKVVREDLVKVFGEDVVSKYERVISNGDGFIGGADYDTVLALAKEDRKIELAVDEYPEGLSLLVYNGGSEEEPSLYIASYSCVDSSIDSLEDFAKLVGENPTIYDRGEIRSIIYRDYIAEDEE